MPYPRAALASTHRAEHVRRQADWRLAAAASAVLCIGLAAVLSVTVTRPAIAVHVFEVDRSSDFAANGGPSSLVALIDGRAAPEPGPRATDPTWRSARVRPHPVDRPPPVTPASNARAQR